MRSTLLLGVLAALLSSASVGCSGEVREVVSAVGVSTSQPPRTLVVGVGEDVPGFSTLDADGRPVGFDVDVARYVARGLGWSQLEVEYRPIPNGERARSLESGEVDLVVSTFRTNLPNERLVDFAGPYLIGRQDLLVQAGNAVITGPHSLDGSILCSVIGSPDAAVLQQERFSPAVRLRREGSLADCVDDLLTSQVDAVTADDVVLDGYVAEHPGELKVVESPFLLHSYGIGLPEGSPDVAIVNELIADMAEEGAWGDSYRRNLSPAGTTVPDPPVPGVLVPVASSAHS